MSEGMTPLEQDMLELFCRKPMEAVSLLAALWEQVHGGKDQVELGRRVPCRFNEQGRCLLPMSEHRIRPGEIRGVSPAPPSLHNNRQERGDQAGERV